MSGGGKTVFDHLSEQIDSVVRGRRYIIAEIGKLKVTLEEFKEAIEKSSGGSNLGSLVGDMKAFMQSTVSTLTDLKGTVSQLSGVVNSLQSQMQQVSSQVQALKASGGAVRAAAPAPAPTQQQYAPAPAPAPMTQRPAAAPAPAPMSYQAAPAPAPMAAPAPAPSAGGDTFGELTQAANGGKSAKELGEMIDGIRTNLSKANPLNPILFELSIEAGRLKSMGGKALDAAGISQLQQKIDKWKTKA